MKNLEIIENSLDYSHEDMNDFMKSNNMYIDEIPESVRHEVLNSYDYFAIAKVDGKMVGVIEALSNNGYSTTILLFVGVHKDYQRQGIGTELMKTFQAKYGHTTIWAIPTIVHGDGSLKFLSTFGINKNKYYTICSSMRQGTN